MCPSRMVGGGVFAPDQSLEDKTAGFPVKWPICMAYYKAAEFFDSLKHRLRCKHLIWEAVWHLLGSVAACINSS